MSPSPEKLMQYLLMLRNSGITDKRVLHAMELIPRDPFATGAFPAHLRSWQQELLPTFRNWRPSCRSSSPRRRICRSGICTEKFG